MKKIVLVEPDIPISALMSRMLSGAVGDRGEVVVIEAFSTAVEKINSLTDVAVVFIAYGSLTPSSGINIANALRMGGHGYTAKIVITDTEESTRDTVEALGFDFRLKWNFSPSDTLRAFIGL